MSPVVATICFMPTDANRQAKNRARLRLQTLEGISGGKPKCVCCGEKRLWALVIDHINFGGTAERKKSPGSTWRLVRAEYKKTGVYNTKKYQILCATCNHGKRISGDTCYHQKENKYMSENYLAAIKSYVKVFLATVLSLFIAEGADVFAVDFADVRTYVSAGLASILPLLITALDPNDSRFGVNAE